MDSLTTEIDFPRESESKSVRERGIWVCLHIPAGPLPWRLCTSSNREKSLRSHAHTHTHVYIQLRVSSHSGTNKEWLSDQIALEMALFAFQIWCNLQKLSSIADVLEQINLHFILENSQNHDQWQVKFFFVAFYGFMDTTVQRCREAEERRGSKQQGATGRTQTLGCCSGDEGSIHNTPALPTEQVDIKDRSKRCLITLFSIKINHPQVNHQKIKR